MWKDLSSEQIEQRLQWRQWLSSLFLTYFLLKAHTSRSFIFVEFVLMLSILSFCSALFLHSCCRYPFPTVFSTCSKKDLAASLEKGVGMCLYNMPEVKVLYGGQKCGNGYVEEGEECDCGEPEVRSTQKAFNHTCTIGVDQSPPVWLPLNRACKAKCESA